MLKPLAAALLLIAVAATAAEQQLVPTWMTVDAGAHKVTIDVVAGFNPNNSNWNFNGYYDGDITVVVPEGWEVEMTLTHRDGAVPHSLVVMADPGTDNLPLQAARAGRLSAGLLQEPGTGHPGRRPRHNRVPDQRDRRFPVVLRRPRPRAKRHVDAFRGH